MVHYKVNLNLCKGLEDGVHAFCGVSVYKPGEEFHILGPAEGTPTFRPKVDCPDCIRMYDAVINDYLGSKNP